MVDELPVTTEKMFLAVDGYLDLKMYAEAENELFLIPKSYRKHRLYLWLMNRLSVNTEDWETATTVSRSLWETQPDIVDTWVAYAYAVRRYENIKVARSILLRAIERFSEDAIIPYNLACYECQLGNNDRARLYLKRALSLDTSFRAMAIEDEDLVALRDEISLW
ncbi:MAG: hypothetical protein GY941_23105 [Planctomycetes bacterium]|nr:hypothetical protein [Planctomycetota bacterium]